MSLLSTLLEFDSELFLFINQGLINTVFDLSLPVITHIGSILFWFFIAVFFWFRKKRKLAFLLIVGLILDIIIVGGLKTIVRRERPYLQLPTRILVRESGMSFPSGHSERSFLSVIIISNFYPRYKLFLYILSSLIAFSRVYVGVHYPFDVIVGACIGIITGILILKSKKINKMIGPIEKKWKVLKERMPILKKIEDIVCFGV